MTMRITGHLYIVGERDRRMPVHLDLGDSFSILGDDGTVVASMDPRLVSMQRVEGSLFELEFGDRKFGFLADDELMVSYMFLPDLAARHQATIQAGNSSASALTDLLHDGPSDVESPPGRPVEVGDEQVDVREALPIDPSERVIGPTEGTVAPLPSQSQKRRLSLLRLPVDDLRRPRRRERPLLVDVGGVRMAYRVAGAGRPVVVVGGAFGAMGLWQDVVDHLASEGRVYSVDLVGFGESDRIPDADISAYEWPTHVHYFGEWLSAMGLDDDLAVISHGFNTVVALEWARRNERRLRAVGYVEGVLRPMAWPEAGPWLRDVVKRARNGEDRSFLLESEEFVPEAAYEFAPEGLDSEGLTVLRKALGPPGAARLAHLAAFANLPLGGQPHDASEMLRSCYQWLKKTPVPKLAVLGRPGYLLRNRARKLVLGIPGQTVSTVPGSHLLPLTSPEAVGTFIKLWLRGL